MKTFPPTQSVESNSHGMTAMLANGACLKIQALAPRMMRVTFKPSAGYKEPRTWAITPDFKPEIAHLMPWNGRERDSLQGFTPPTCGVSADHVLSTGSLQVRLSAAPQHGSPVLTWSDGQGKTIAQDRATSAYFASTRTGCTRHYLERDPQDRYYGLGDKTGVLNLHGRRLRTLALDSLGFDPQRGDPLYKHWPFVMTRTPQGQWYGIYYDTLAACTFDLGHEHDNYHGLYRYVDIDDGDLDYYFMAGDSPAQVIAQFMQLIGGTALPPQWSIRYAQTAMGLADAPDAQHQLDQFIDRAVSEGVPVGSFHYGSGYSSKGKRRYVFTWNNSKFPEPKKLNDKFHAKGMQIVANIKPCLLDDHPDYAAVKAFGGFIHDAKTQEPTVEQFWDGVGAHLDFTHPKTIAWWQASLKRQVLDYGIDVGWNDNNEYGVMEDEATCHGFGQSMPIHRARPLHAMLMTRATYEAQQSHAPDQAVYTISRGGSPGIQRYAQTWSGDNSTSWESLRWNIRTGLQMSLSGMFNIGHDVGGFSGPKPDPELFVRWVQACCLNPRMVMNSWNTDGSVNLPWMHESVKREVIDAIKLRERLLPYLWSLFERAAQQHEPIIRPTFYDFPNDEQCFADCDDFMLGASLLVAPVVQAGQTERRVYLPMLVEGDVWTDFYTGEPLNAGHWHSVAAPLARLPLFKRGNYSLIA